MIDFISNRDMGDEHRDSLRHIDFIVVTHSDHDGDSPARYAYPCSSDQYTDTHVYAHGDDGDDGDGSP